MRALIPPFPSCAAVNSWQLRIRFKRLPTFSILFARVNNRQKAFTPSQYG